MRALLIFFIALTCQFSNGQEPIKNMTRENKIEVVSALQTYPLLLEDLDTYFLLYNQCNDIKVIFYKQMVEYQKSNDDFRTSNIALKEANKILGDQLKQERKKGKGGWVVPTLVGVGVGFVLGVSL